MVESVKSDDAHRLGKERERIRVNFGISRFFTFREYGVHTDY